MEKNFKTAKILVTIRKCQRQSTGSGTSLAGSWKLTISDSDKHNPVPFLWFCRHLQMFSLTYLTTILQD